MESSLGYHPDSTEVLTGCHESGDRTLLGGQFDWGGRLLKSNGGAKGSLRTVGNRSKSAKAEGSLTATPTSGAVSSPLLCTLRTISDRSEGNLGASVTF